MDFLQKNAGYQSELDKLFVELKRQDSSVVEGQREGMSLLWNRDPLNVEARRRDNQSRVKQPAYVYR